MCATRISRNEQGGERGGESSCLGLASEHDDDEADDELGRGGLPASLPCLVPLLEQHLHNHQPVHLLFIHARH